MKPKNFGQVGEKEGFVRPKLTSWEENDESEKKLYFVILYSRFIYCFLWDSNFLPFNIIIFELLYFKIWLLIICQM